MENAEEIYHFLEDFSKRKPKVIPQELNDYLAYVARTGDPVYQWSLVKSLFKEKLLNVITDFHEATPAIEIPPYPNVDPFNYDIMKNSLLERLDSFTSAPFTVQRICELLTFPRKQYNRIDKFMRAIEKNILVVSTREPGAQRHPEPENGEVVEAIVNGSDNNSEYNVDVEMEDMSWKENAEQPQQQNTEPQPSSSDTHISVDDLEARLQAKQDVPMDTQEKISTQYESVTPPELNVTDEMEMKSNEPEATAPATDPLAQETSPTDRLETAATEPKLDVEMKTDETDEPAKETLVIPEIKVDDAEMTEQRLNEESKQPEQPESVDVQQVNVTPEPTEPKIKDIQPNNIDESSSDSLTKDETEPKLISDVSTSSEESSSSSENTDGNSNSPKNDNEAHIDVQEDISSDTNQSDSNALVEEKPSEPAPVILEAGDTTLEAAKLQADNYSISDMKSEIQEPSSETPSEKTNPTETSETTNIEAEIKPSTIKEDTVSTIKEVEAEVENKEEQKAETTETIIESSTE